MRKYDAIVVLGAALQPDGTPGLALRRRVQHGAALFHAKAADVLFLSGGSVGHPLAEAVAMHRLALEAGVPSDRIILETKSRTTLENARESAQLMRENGWVSAVLVSDLWHLPRAALAFYSAGIRVKLDPVKDGWHKGILRDWWFRPGFEAIAVLWYALMILCAGRTSGPAANGKFTRPAGEF